jgi:hypothetical protein
MNWFFFSSFVYLTATDYRPEPRYALTTIAALIYAVILTWVQVGFLYSVLLTFLALELLYRAVFLYLFMSPVSFLYHLSIQQKMVWNLVLLSAFCLIYWFFQSVVGLYWLTSCIVSFITLELLLRVICLVGLRGL